MSTNPLVKSGRKLVAFSSACAAVLAIWLRRRRTRKHLAQLETRLLTDVGLTEPERGAECRKSFWRR